MTD
jgi:hypothetical protein